MTKHKKMPRILFLRCEACGNEQPDMGSNVACENCGARMPEPGVDRND